MNPNAKSLYQDPTLRKKEISSQNIGVPTESAFAYLNERLQEYSLHPYAFTAEEQQALLKLLCELQLEQLRQTGQGIDYRAISSFKEAYRMSKGLEEQTKYNGAVTAHWQTITQQYERTGRFIIDLGAYTVEPVPLDLKEHIDLRYSCKPSTDVGFAICFEKALEEAVKKDMQKQPNPDIQLSWGHLHNAKMSLGLYSRLPEPVCLSFKKGIEARLEEFKRQHGSLTPTLTVPIDGRVFNIVGGDNVMAGIRITVKRLVEESDEPKGLLGKLLAKLPSV